MAANTLTNLIPTIHAALDEVAREPIGMIRAVARNSEAEIAAVGETVQYPVTPTLSSENATPAAYPPDYTGISVGTKSMTISKSKVVPFGFTGEEQRGLRNSKPTDNYNTILRDLFSQAFRVIVNEVEADLALLYKEASRAYGTAGTAPFGTAGDLSDIAQVRKILQDNGCPMIDLQLVLNTSAGANMRGKQSSLFKVNEAGSQSMLREGALEQLQGFMIHESAGLPLHTKGTGANYDTDHAGAATQPIGTTTLHVDTGTGTIVAGDVVTFTGDSNKYIVGTGFAGDGDGDIVLNKPGLRATNADSIDMVIGNSYTPNLAFRRNAIQLVARQPLMPEGGDGADDVINVADPVTGLIFQVAMYGQYRQRRIEVGLAWGVEAVKSEFMAILLG
jgi:surface antigen